MILLTLLAATTSITSQGWAQQDNGTYDPSQSGQTQNYDPGQNQQGPPVPSDVQAQAPVTVQQPAGNVDLNTFETGLSQYGEWVEVPGAGRVWRPSNTHSDWRPYYHGHWIWTTDGWYWDSDEPWGWGPYHYGRWNYWPAYGWGWSPGYQWAPAWVSWRYSGLSIGWAPLLPGISIYATSYPYYDNHWTFVPCHSFVGVSVNTVAYASGYNNSVFHSTSPAPALAAGHGISAAPAFGGPARPFVESKIGHTLAPAPTVQVSSAAQYAAVRNQGSVPVFRPGAATPLGHTAVPFNPQHPAGTIGSPSPQNGSRPLNAAPPATGRPSMPQSFPSRSGPHGWNTPAPAPGQGQFQAPARPAAQNSYGNNPWGWNNHSAPSPRFSGPPAQYRAPDQHYAPPIQRYGAPQGNYSAPRAQSSYQAPHYSAPQYSAQHYSAPAPHYSAPQSSGSQHFSAPSYSAPHSSGGGGGGGAHFGFSGGGGRHR